MSVKILAIHVPEGKMPLSGEKPWKFANDYSAYFDAIIDGVQGKLFCNFYSGYQLDFCSAPWPWSIKVPQFLDDPAYDVCAGAHDVGFGLEGCVKGLGRKLKAGEVDDILRGGWRCWGMSRFFASTSDFFLVFAHTKRHWGADQYKCRDRAELVWIPNEKNIGEK